MSLSVCMVLAAVVVSLLAIRVSSYPDRIPSSACTDMFPSGHDVEQQKTPAPFRLSASHATYSVGSEIIVTLETMEAGYHVKGFFVQTRKAVGCGAENDVPQGEFTESSSFISTMSCAGPSDSVFHSSDAEKPGAQFTWRATESVGPIYFRATVVWKKKTFWTNIFSPIVGEAALVENAEICDPGKPVIISPPRSEGSSRHHAIAPLMVMGLAALYLTR